MNILFLSMAFIGSLNDKGMYPDMLREFVSRGHNVTVLSPIEKRNNIQQSVCYEENTEIHKVRVGNVTNTPFIEKGISVIRLQHELINYIKMYLSEKKFDLFVVAVPPVTFEKIVSFVKEKYNCRVYLLLKDFWPDSILDLKTPGGEIAKKIVYLYFRKKEIRLYKNSDKIGLMSPKNQAYLLEHNSYLTKDKTEVNPNSIAPEPYQLLSLGEKYNVRNKYGIPKDKICFIYGGTLGVGQNVPHIVECMKACKSVDCHFVISGKGVQYNLLDDYLKQSNQNNITLINGLPKGEYDKLLRACDVGLVFLRYSALTPNFPSRILSYMEYGKPVLCCTDPVTDLGAVLEKGRFGWGCLSNDPIAFKKTIEKVLKEKLDEYSYNSRKYLENNYTAQETYNKIINSMELRM